MNFKAVFSQHGDWAYAAHVLLIFTLYDTRRYLLDAALVVGFGMQSFL